MKRIILILVCSLAVFAATMVLTYKYVEKEALQDADQLNALLVDRVGDYANRTIRHTETDAVTSQDCYMHGKLSRTPQALPNFTPPRILNTNYAPQPTTYWTISSGLIHMLLRPC